MSASDRERPGKVALLLYPNNLFATPTSLLTLPV